MKNNLSRKYKREIELGGVILDVSGEAYLIVRLPNNVEGFVAMDLFKGNSFNWDGVITQRCSRTGRVITIGTILNVIAASAQVATGRVDFAPDEDAEE